MDTALRMIGDHHVYGPGVAPFEMLMNIRRMVAQGIRAAIGGTSVRPVCIVLFFLLAKVVLGHLLMNRLR